MSGIITGVEKAAAKESLAVLIKIHFVLTAFPLSFKTL